jgi:DNA topoisomerase-2
LEHRQEEGEKIEPYFFLPIIPMILVNGSQGIAVGFASNILNRDIKELIKKCQEVLEGKKMKTLKPHLNSFKGEWIQDVENPLRWIIRGKFEVKNTTTLEITELPPSLTYEKYEKYLDKLIEDDVIQDYEDNCQDDVNYIIKFKRSDLSKLSQNDLIKILKLEETQTENLSTIDENGKLKLFESIDDMIKYFVEFRLKYYDERKKHLLEKLNKELKLILNKSKFIQLILDNKIIVNNKTKIQIFKQIESHKLEMIDESYDYLLRMPIYSLTKEIYDKLKNDLKVKEDELKNVEKLQPKEMYIDDLKQLSKNV